MKTIGSFSFCSKKNIHTKFCVHLYMIYFNHMHLCVCVCVCVCGWEPCLLPKETPDAAARPCPPPTGHWLHWGPAWEMGHFRFLSLRSLALYQTKSLTWESNHRLGQEQLSRSLTKPYRISQSRASLIQSHTPPSLILCIYSAGDLGSIQFKLQNKTIKGVGYPPGTKKRSCSPASSQHRMASSRAPPPPASLGKSRRFVLTQPFDKISLWATGFSQGKLEEPFRIRWEFWSGPCVVQKSGEYDREPWTWKMELAWASGVGRVSRGWTDSLGPAELPCSRCFGWDRAPRPPSVGCRPNTRPHMWFCLVEDFHRGDEAKRRSLGWILIQRAWCPHEGRSGHRHAGRRRPLPAKERPQQKAALPTAGRALRKDFSAV